MWGQGAFAIKFYPKALKSTAVTPSFYTGSLQGAFTLCFPSQQISRNPCHAVLEELETAPLKGSPGPCRTKAAAKEVLGADRVAQFSSDLITGLGLAR